MACLSIGLARMGLISDGVRSAKFVPLAFVVLKLLPTLGSVLS